MQTTPKITSISQFPVSLTSEATSLLFLASTNSPVSWFQDISNLFDFSSPCLLQVASCSQVTGLAEHSTLEPLAVRFGLFTYLGHKFYFLFMRNWFILIPFRKHFVCDFSAPEKCLINCPGESSSLSAGQDQCVSRCPSNKTLLWSGGATPMDNRVTDFHGLSHETAKKVCVGGWSTVHWELDWDHKIYFT